MRRKAEKTKPCVPSRVAMRAVAAGLSGFVGPLCANGVVSLAASVAGPALRPPALAPAHPLPAAAGRPTYSATHSGNSRANGIYLTFIFM